MDAGPAAEPLARLPGAVTHVAIAPAGDLVAAAWCDGAGMGVGVWPLAGGPACWTRLVPAVSLLAFRPEGDMVVGGGRTGPTRPCNLEALEPATGAALAAWDVQHPPTRLAPAGGMVATWLVEEATGYDMNDTCAAQVWDLATGRSRWWGGGDVYAWCYEPAVFLPDGRLLLGDHDAIALDPATWRTAPIGCPVAGAQPFPGGHPVRVLIPASAFQGAGDATALGAAGLVIVGLSHKLTKRHILRTFVRPAGLGPSQDHVVWTVSAGGEVAATIGEPGRLFLWDLATGSYVEPRGFGPFAHPARCASLSADGGLIVVGTGDGRLVTLGTGIGGESLAPTITAPTTGAARTGLEPAGTDSRRELPKQPIRPDDLDQFAE